MHELSICHSIAGIIRKHAGDRRVERVNLQVGQLRQVIPETLTYCWSLVCAETDLEGSELSVEHVLARIRCTACDAVETITVPVMICPRCDGRDVELVSGEEFLITSLELAEA